MQTSSSTRVTGRVSVVVWGFKIEFLGMRMKKRGTEAYSPLPSAESTCTAPRPPVTKKRLSSCHTSPPCLRGRLGRQQAGHCSTQGKGWQECCQTHPEQAEKVSWENPAPPGTCNLLHLFHNTQQLHILNHGGKIPCSPQADSLKVVMTREFHP